MSLFFRIDVRPRAWTARFLEREESMSTQEMSVLQDLRKFVRQHRTCGVLTIHLEPPADTAYSIEIGCRACDAALCRTVDAAAAAWDLTHTDLLLGLN